MISQYGRNLLRISFFFEKNEIMEFSTTQIPKQAPIENEVITLESVDFFVRMMSIMGLPRSVGEIYGLLYFSEDPLSMDQICKKLGMSVGSASQGLKTLRHLKSIKTIYVPGERKDHFLAETEFRKLFSNFIKDEILPHLESASERIWRIENNLETVPPEKEEFYKIRIEKLKRLTKAGKRLLPALAGLLKL